MRHDLKVTPVPGLIGTEMADVDLATDQRSAPDVGGDHSRPYAAAARTHVKRMLNERYGHIDYQTMFWALDHSPEPREGMQAFLEKRPPSWVPPA